MKYLSSCLQILFPKKHIAVHLFYGLSFSLAYILPHPNGASRDTLLVIEGVYIVLLCIFSLVLYPKRSELFFLPSSGWLALSLAVSGLFFLAFSALDWMAYQNPPLIAVLIGGGVLLCKFIFTFRKVARGETAI